MHKNILIPIFLLSFSFLACNKDHCPPFETTASTLYILPLGDSRVEGARPHFDSYRYELWKLLVQNSWDFDFIGGRLDQGKYSDLNGLCFDNEHEGTGGATTEDILGTLEEETFSNVPDVVLLGIGGNDLMGEVPVNQIIANIHAIIDTLQVRNPNVTIFVEQIAPGTTEFMTADLTSTFVLFNSRVGEIPASQTTATSLVVSVDMSVGWSDEFMADEVHYNEAGAKIVAGRYYDSMDLHVIR